MDLWVRAPPVLPGGAGEEGRGMTAPAVPEGMKRCSKCGEIKPLNEFYHCSSVKGGLRYECKACTSKCRRKYYTQTRDKALDYSKKYCACVKHPSCPLVGGRGAEFITFTCEVCGAEFRCKKSLVDWQYEHRGCLPRFCSRDCYYASMRKNYKSPYAKKIEDIKKRLKN